MCMAQQQQIGVLQRRPGFWAQAVIGAMRQNDAQICALCPHGGQCGFKRGHDGRAADGTGRMRACGQGALGQDASDPDPQGVAHVWLLAFEHHKGFELCRKRVRCGQAQVGADHRKIGLFERLGEVVEPEIKIMVAKGHRIIVQGIHGADHRMVVLRFAAGGLGQPVGDWRALEKIARVQKQIQRLCPARRGYLQGGAGQSTALKQAVVGIVIGQQVPVDIAGLQDAKAGAGVNAGAQGRTDGGRGSRRCQGRMPFERRNL